MSKPKVAFYWCASCGGCEETVVDLAEDLLGIVEKVDIVFWPIALDFKLEDVKKLGKGEITVSFINGSIANTENEEVVKLLRERSQFVVAFGSCSYTGGIPALRNLYTAEEAVRRAYIEAPSVENPEGVLPSPKWKDEEDRELTLPSLLEKVKALDEVVEVDYYLPGCPPPPELVKDVINRFLEGNLPERGSVLTPSLSLCSDCPRRDTKPEKISLKDFKRLATTQPDPSTCFLAQGIICLGPVTRTGCGHRCIMANMPCRGCFGPVDTTKDMGISMLTALASMIDAEPGDEERLRKLLEEAADLTGTLWRFTMSRNPLLNKEENHG